MAAQLPLSSYPGWDELRRWAKHERRTAPPCVRPGCSNPQYARKLCRACYERRRRKRSKFDPALIVPDDGIVDGIALEIAVTGMRVVRMTRKERRLAARRILLSGGDVPEVAARLGISQDSARLLVKRAER